MFEEKFKFIFENITNGDLSNVSSSDVLELELQISKEEDFEKFIFIKSILNLIFFRDKEEYVHALRETIMFVNKFSFKIDFFIENLTNISLRLSNSNISKILNLNNEDNSRFSYFINSNFCKLILEENQYALTRFVNYHFENNRIVFNDMSHRFHESINVLNERVLNIKSETYQIKNNSGLEDVRLFFDKDEKKINFLATSTMFNDANKNEMILGELLEKENILNVKKIFRSPFDKNEKNWIILDENKNILYDFYPFTTFDFDLCSKREIKNLPKIFQLLRASSNAIEINGFRYILAHSLNTSENYKKPMNRSYSHWLIILNTQNEPIAYSIPFSFEGENIEYCLSMNYLKNGNLEFCYSVWDNSSKYLEIPLSYFNDKFLTI